MVRMCICAAARNKRMAVLAVGAQHRAHRSVGRHGRAHGQCATPIMHDSSWLRWAAAVSGHRRVDRISSRPAAPQRCAGRSSAPVACQTINHLVECRRSAGASGDDRNSGSCSQAGTVGRRHAEGCVRVGATEVSVAGDAAGRDRAGELLPLPVLPVVFTKVHHLPGTGASVEWSPRLYRPQRCCWKGFTGPHPDVVAKSWNAPTWWMNLYHWLANTRSEIQPTGIPRRTLEPVLRSLIVGVADHHRRGHVDLCRRDGAAGFHHGYRTTGQRCRFIVWMNMPRPLPELRQQFGWVEDSKTVLRHRPMRLLRQPALRRSPALWLLGGVLLLADCSVPRFRDVQQRGHPADQSRGHGSGGHRANLRGHHRRLVLSVGQVLA